MNEEDVYFEYDLLRGDINRMFLTDDVEELLEMHEFAQKRIERIYEYHYARLNNK